MPAPNSSKQSRPGRIGVEMRSDEQGAEHLAEIVAWVLMGSDPADAPQLPNNSLAELTEAFDVLTGR